VASDAVLGLFPLGIVLLPTERVPLHIFEPRYKELIGECLDEDGDFGLVLAEEDGMRTVGTRATVVEVLDRLADGRLNIVVEGGARFRIVELTSGRSFHTAAVEPLADEEGAAPAAELERAESLVRRLAAITGADVPEPAAEQPSFSLAAHLALAPPVKQRLLELRSETDRLRALAEVLEPAVRRAELARKIGEHAATNGKVTRPD
jgi:Lon protease-like protein